jgi:hypothetical protein
MGHRTLINMDFISTRDRHPRRKSYLGVVVTVISVALIAAYAFVSLQALTNNVVRSTDILPIAPGQLTDVKFTCLCSAGCLIAFPPGECSYNANEAWRVANTPAVNSTGSDERTAARWVAPGSVHDFRLCTRGIGSDGVIVMGAMVDTYMLSTIIVFHVGACTAESSIVGSVLTDDHDGEIIVDLDRLGRRNLVLRREVELDVQGAQTSIRLAPQTEAMQDCTVIDAKFNYSNGGFGGFARVTGDSICTGISIDSTVIQNHTRPATTIWIMLGNIGGAANFIYSIAYGIMSLYSRCVHKTQWPPHHETAARRKTDIERMAETELAQVNIEETS